MANLESKFEALEAQLASQHAEMMAQLGSIAVALGAPPTAPTATLEDVIYIIGNTNTYLSGIYSLLTTNLASIAVQLDTLNENQSLNAQLMIAAMYATFCPCDSDVPLLTPPLDTTPTSAEEDALCARIQYFIDMYASYIGQVSTYIGSGAALSGDVLNTLLLSQLSGRSISTGELASTGGIPSSVRSIAISQLTTAIAYNSRSAVAAGISQISSSTNTTALQQALYSANNAADGKSAFDVALDASSIGNAYIGILQTLFYSSWTNDIYSDVPDVDDSMYDGSICAPIVEPECYNGTSQLYSSDNGATYPYYGAVWPFGWTTADRDYDNVPYTHHLFLASSAMGFTFRLITGSNVYIGAYNGVAGNFDTVYEALLTESTITIPAETNIVTIYSAAANGAFTFEVCVPAEL